MAVWLQLTNVDLTLQDLVVITGSNAMVQFYRPGQVDVK